MKDVAMFFFSGLRMTMFILAMFGFLVPYTMKEFLLPLGTLWAIIILVIGIVIIVEKRKSGNSSD
ncbi:MAG: hypothetical protein RTS72_02890 [Candidatus Thorarchaeota archaeon]